VTEPLDELRDVADQTAPPRPELEEYLAKVRDRAYTITDDDIGVLKAGGVPEDEIFEQTVGMAIGQGLRRLDAAKRAIG
jgi:hypothetical protein